MGNVLSLYLGCVYIKLEMCSQESLFVHSEIVARSYHTIAQFVQTVKQTAIYGVISALGVHNARVWYAQFLLTGINYYLKVCKVSLAMVIVCGRE